MHRGRVGQGPEMSAAMIDDPSLSATTNGAPSRIEPGGRERLPALDLLRFIAAMMVVLFHYTFRGAADGVYLTTTFPELDGITRYGSFGVDLFFLISGFVILLTVDAGGGRPGHFVASRVSRLFPVFWVAMTLTFVVCALSGASFAVGPFDYVRNLGMFPSWLRAPYVDGAYWTLELELTFYLLIVAFLLFLQRRITIEWLLIGWLIVIAPFVPDDFGPGRLRLAIMVESAPFFIAGCLFYRIWREGWTRMRLGILIAAWLFAVVIAVRGADVATVDFGSPTSPWIAAAVASFGFVVLLALCLRPAWFRFGGRRATFLGALTYPLYLVHQNIGYVVINSVDPIGGRWVALSVSLAIILVLAYGLHRFVERRYNSRFRRWLEPRVKPIDRLAGMTAPTASTSPLRDTIGS